MNTNKNDRQCAFIERREYGGWENFLSERGFFFKTKIIMGLNEIFFFLERKRGDSMGV